MSKQGPDTEYAIKGFANTFRPNSPKSVSKIYYRSHGFEDNHTIFRFQTSDEEFVRGLITQQDLIESKMQEKLYSRNDYPK